MLWHRANYQTNFYCYVPFFLCDSSPQAGKDWVLTECRLLSKEHAVAVFEAVQKLFNTKGQSDQTVYRGALFVILEENCTRHMFAPGAVGARRASLLHKLHAVLHSMRLEMGSWAAVKAFASDTFAFTTDTGVESGLAGVSAPGMKEFFPNIPDVSMPESDGTVKYGGGFEAFDHGEAAAAADAASTFFENALWIQGAKHVCDSCSEKMTDKMVKYPEYLSSLQAIREYFGVSCNRDDFLNNCVMRRTTGAQRDALAELFKQVPPSIQEWRWGSMLTTTNWLLLRMPALRTYWCSQKMMTRDRVAAQQPEKRKNQHAEAKTRFKKVSAAIASDFFWAYASIVALIGKTIQHVDAWFESCPCHTEMGDLLHSFRSDVAAETTRSSWFIRQKILAGDCNKTAAGNTVICPLRGCLAPFLAAGELESYLIELMAIADSSVIMICATFALDEHEKKDLALEFSSARTAVLTFLKLKFAYWRVLPYKAAVLAHPDVDTSRAILRECLLEFEQDRDKGHRHPLTLKLFAEKGGLRAEMECFFRGAALNILPALLCMAARIMLIPLNERSIEARHRDVALGVRSAPNPSPSYISWTLRSTEVKQRMRSG